MAYTYYQILGVGEQATPEEIKKAYKALALKYHPDRTGGNTVLEDHFKKITEAYTVLSQTEKRKRYDLKQAAFQNRKTNTPTPPARPANTRPTPPPPPYRKAPTQQTKNYSAAQPNPGKAKGKAMPARYYWYVAGIFALFISAGIATYVFMNRYSAGLRLQEARYQVFMGNPIQALLLYTEALSFNSTYSVAWFERGVLRRKAFRDSPAARYDLLNAMRYAEVPQAAHAYELALCHLAEKQPVEAIQWLKQALRLNPQSDSAYYALGEAYAFYQVSFDSAIMAFDSALAYNHKHMDALLGKGYSLLKLDRMTDAIQCFTTIITADATYIHAYMLRAEAYIRSNDVTKACADWKKALDLGEKDAETGLKNYCNPS